MRIKFHRGYYNLYWMGFFDFNIFIFRDVKKIRREASVARLYKITPCRDAINRVSTLFPTSLHYFQRLYTISNVSTKTNRISKSV